MLRLAARSERAPLPGDPGHVGSRYCCGRAGPAVYRDKYVDALAIVRNGVAANLDDALSDPTREMTCDGIFDHADIGEVFRHDVDEGVF